MIRYRKKPHSGGMSLYERIIASVRADAKLSASWGLSTGEDGCVTVVDGDGVLLVDDCRNADRTRYGIRNPETITEEWLRKRVVSTITALPFGLDEEKIAAWIFASVPKWMLMTLRGVVLCGYEVVPNFRFDEYDGFFGDPSFEDRNMFENDGLGFSLLDYGLMYANVPAHFRLAPGRKAALDDLAVTLVHEIRHIAQANPYLPDFLVRQDGGEEQDAELFARRFVAAHPIGRNAMLARKQKKSGRPFRLRRRKS